MADFEVRKALLLPLRGDQGSPPQLKPATNEFKNYRYLSTQPSHNTVTIQLFLPPHPLYSPPDPFLDLSVPATREE